MNENVEVGQVRVHPKGERVRVTHINEEFGTVTLATLADDWSCACVIEVVAEMPLVAS